MDRRDQWIAVIGATLVCLAAVGLWHAFGPGRTPGIEGPLAVAVLEELDLSGSRQWVLIRGQDRTKPVLLFLHGGPGMPAMYLAHAWQSGLERDFVVVHWDRRGAGKSFLARGEGPGLSVRQVLADTYEITRRLRTRFAQDRIYLVGHSWGSYLGMLAAREHPEYYLAYIGTGQLAGRRDEVHALRRAVLSRAAVEAGDRELIDRLADPGYVAAEDELFRYGGELHGARSFWPLLSVGLRAPEYSLRDAVNVKRGADWTEREMRYDVLPRPLEGEIDSLGLPVFFLVGRHDLNTPGVLAEAYLQRLVAPLKELVWFGHSAHFPFFEEPERFHVELVRIDSAVRQWRAGASPDPGIIRSPR